MALLLVNAAIGAVWAATIRGVAPDANVSRLDWQTY
jgi:hypothetical protein